MGLGNLLKSLKDRDSFFHLRKRRNRNIRAHAAELGNQPMFTSRSVKQERKRGGLIVGIRSRLHRASRRKELKGTSVSGFSRTGNRIRGVLVPVFLVALVVIFAFVAYRPLVAAIADLKFFKIREIAITGCRVTTPALIRELTGIRYQSSLVTTQPTYIEAILRTHPWISEVKVTRDWPDVLVVAIKEYAAEALIAQDVSGNRRLFYLDKSGVAFAPVEPGQDMDYPVITGFDGNEDAGLRQKMIKEVLAFLKLVRQNNPNLPVQNLSEIHVDRDAGMTIYLVDYPFPVYFGFGEIRTKYSRLKRVLEVLYKDSEQGMNIADVTYIRMDYLENKVLVAHSGSG